MKSKPSYTIYYTLLMCSLSTTQVYSTSVQAPVIRFGAESASQSDGDNQGWNNTGTTDNGSSVTWIVDGRGVNNWASTGLSFSDNDEATLSLTATSSTGSLYRQGSDLGNTLDGGNDAIIDANTSITFTLNVSVNSGFYLKTLYLDQLTFGEWDTSTGSTVEFSDGTNTDTYTGTSAPVFRYSGTPNSNVTSGSHDHDPVGVYWYDPDSTNDQTITGLNAISPTNVDDSGDGTWELTVKNTGTTDIDIQHLYIHYEIAPVPEPTTTSLLGLSGLAFLLRRKRK